MRRNSLLQYPDSRPPDMHNAESRNGASFGAFASLKVRRNRDVLIGPRRAFFEPEVVARGPVSDA